MRLKYYTHVHAVYYNYYIDDFYHTRVHAHELSIKWEGLARKLMIFNAGHEDGHALISI